MSSRDNREDRQNATLRRLLHRVADGDPTAFRKLYDATSPHLYAIALKMMRGHAAADDVLQDAFVQVWHRAGDYHVERGRVIAWLATIVRYRAIDRLRGRRSGMPLDESPGGMDPIDPDAAAGPLNSAMAADDSRFLSRCLERLSDTQQQSVALAFFHGLTHAELADSLALPLGTIKSRLRRSLQRLRECLEAIGFTDEISSGTG